MKRVTLVLAIAALFAITACASTPEPTPQQPPPPPTSQVEAPEAAPTSTKAEVPEAQPEAPAAKKWSPQGDGFGDRGYLTGLKSEWTASNKRSELFLVLAVKRGLYLDGVGAKEALAVANEEAGEHWVPKCPICRPVERAFREHAAHVKADNLGPLRAPFGELKSPEMKARHKAIGQIVNDYVQGAVIDFGIEGEALKTLQKDLAKDRKQGMQGKPGSYEYCPSCEGAVGGQVIL